ncbi:hypothetical protein ACX80N_12320 [Arthrobacter sp. MDT2-16]
MRRANHRVDVVVQSDESDAVKALIPEVDGSTEEKPAEEAAEATAAEGH